MGKSIKKAGKKFLNKDGFHSSASINWEVGQTTIRVDDKGVMGNFLNDAWHTLEIRDCSNTISLEFSQSLKHHDNNAFKIRILIEELEKFEKHLLKSQERHKMLKKIHKPGETVPEEYKKYEKAS